MRRNKNKLSKRNKKSRTNLRKKNKKYTQKLKGRGKGDMFNYVIKNAFKMIAEENGWSDYDAAADEYLEFLRNMPETTMNGGGIDFQKYLNFVLGAVIGKFDTTCNKILSNLAFVLYCIMITTFIKAYNKHGSVGKALEDEEYVHSLADPVQYVLYYNFKLLYNFQEQIFSIFRTCAQKVLESVQIPAESTSAYISMTIRIALYNPQLYNTFIVKPIACILSPVIDSCRTYCD